jgi:hypothetical protein
MFLGVAQKDKIMTKPADFKSNAAVKDDIGLNKLSAWPLSTNFTAVYVSSVASILPWCEYK